MDRLFDLIVGAPKSGKSTFAAKVIKQYKQNVIIVKHTSNINDDTHAFLTEKTMDNWRQGAAPGQFVKCKMAFDEKSDYLPFLEWVKQHYRYGLLIIDDATIFEDYKMSKPLKNIVSMRRHYKLSVVLIYHGFMACPIDQFIFANRLIIFNCNDNITRKKDRIPKFTQVERAIEMSKRNYMSANPKVKYRPTIVDITSI